MKAFFNGAIKIANKNSFIDKLDVMVEYFTYVIQGENSDSIELNSKKDLYSYLDKQATFTIDVQKKDKVYTVKLIDVQPLHVEEGEKTIE